jgi:putative membrane protein insertion efficiency factor
LQVVYARVVAGLLRGYKVAVSPWLPRSCRFLPTCSEYAAAVLVSHGPAKGGWLAMRRVCRCRPFGPSGYDPPPGPAALKCDA